MEEGGGIGGCILVALLVLLIFGGEIEVSLGFSFLDLFVWVFIGLACLTAGIIFLACLYTDPQKNLKVVTSPIWVPHYALAWLGLLIVRNPWVRNQFIRDGEPKEAIKFWLVDIPGMAIAFWPFPASVFLICELNLLWWLAVVLALFSAGMFIAFYYHLYFNQTPQGSDWPIFVSAEEQLELGGRLWYIEHITQLKLWWRNWW